jgi:hypothetical protein
MLGKRTTLRRSTNSVHSSGGAKQRRTKRLFNQRTFIHNSHKIYRSDLTQRTFSCRSRTTTETLTDVPLSPPLQMNKGSRRYESQPLFRRSYLKSLNTHPFIVYPSQSIHSRRSTRACRQSITISRWGLLSLIKLLIIIKLNKESH